MTAAVASSRLRGGAGPCGRRDDDVAVLAAMLLVLTCGASTAAAVKLPPKTPPGPCALSPCGAASKCVEVTNSSSTSSNSSKSNSSSTYTCVCASGTTPANNTKGLPYCRDPCTDGSPGGPCGVGAKCAVNGTRNTCNCSAGNVVYDGFSNGSQTCIPDPCKAAPPPCGPNGQCTVLARGNTCTCKSPQVLFEDEKGFQSCIADPCKAGGPFGPCGMNGTCTVVGRGNTCTCNSTQLVYEKVKGFQTCVTDPCLSAPCGPNAKSCSPVVPASWKCTCAAGATLVGAQENLQYCKLIGTCNDGTRYGPCGTLTRPEGVCTETSDGNSCACAAVDIPFDVLKNGSQTCVSNPCSTNPCGQGGKCTPGSDTTWACECGAGTVLVEEAEGMQHCTDGPCPPQACGAGGTCMPLSNSTRSCTCAAGLTLSETIPGMPTCSSVVPGNNTSTKGAFINSAVGHWSLQSVFLHLSISMPFLLPYIFL